MARVGKSVLKTKLHKMLSGQKISKKSFGGFIIPLITHTIKAVKSNNEHKKRVKQQAHEKSNAYHESKKAELEMQGKKDRELQSAYDKGNKGGKMKKRKC